MLQSIPKDLKAEVKKIQAFLKDGIFPFIERPCDETLLRRRNERRGDEGSFDKTNSGADAAEHVNDASELFSLFTANIIKEEVLFTR